MDIQFFSHACLKVTPDAPGAPAVICDPWFSERGAFLESWYQYPENASLFPEAGRGVKHICVSHNHHDHFDPPVLRAMLDSDPEIILHVCKFKARWFYETYLMGKIPEYAPRVIEHPPFEPYEFAPGACFYFVPEESPAVVDSAIVFTVDGETLLNLNDSRQSPKDLRRIRAELGHIDYLAFQASGASEYPVCYSYSEDDMIRRSVQKRQQKFYYCETVADLCEPTRCFIFAGPPVFLHPDLLAFNDRSETSVFPDQLDILQELGRSRPDLAEKTYFLTPGDHFDDAWLWPRIDLSHERYRSFTDRDAYLESYAESRGPFPPFDFGEAVPDAELRPFFDHMVNVSDYMSRNIGGKVGFRIPHQGGETDYTLDFLAQDVAKGLDEACDCVITVPASILRGVVDREITWDDAMLSLRLHFDERGSFAPHLKTLMRYLDREMFVLLEEYENAIAQMDREDDDAFMEIELDGERLLVQRRCPHAGVDLKDHGIVGEDGTITCTAHRFCFDLRSGECLNA